MRRCADPSSPSFAAGSVPGDRRRVLSLLEGCRLLPQPEYLWPTTGDLGAALARRGLTVKTVGLLIAKYAVAHGVPVLAADSDFHAIARADVGFSLAR